MARRPRSPIELGDIKGARNAPFPGFVPLCHSTLRSTVPEGRDWTYEVKLRGITEDGMLRHPSFKGLA